MISEQEQQLKQLAASHKSLADAVDVQRAATEKRFSAADSKSIELCERNAKDIQSTTNQVQDLAEALKLCGKAEHGSALDKRVTYIEKVIGESADKHDNHKTTVE